MQAKTSSPRDAFTEQQIVDLIESEWLQVDMGLELLDSNDELIEDISDEMFATGEISYNRDALINNTCRIFLGRDIDWHNQRLKVYMTLTDGSVTARFNLGVFLPTTPRRDASNGTEVYVEGYDKLKLLAYPLGRVYQLLEGASYITAIEDLLEEIGETAINIDQTKISTLAPSHRVWNINNANTYQSVINHMLRAIGYNDIWVDENGYFRSEPNELISERDAEWTYSTTSATTTLTTDRSEELDYFNIPNKLIFIRNDPSLGFPEEGDGQYTVTNQSDGPTSIDQRGATFSKIYYIDAANQASLVIQGDQMAEQIKQGSSSLSVISSPNPLHGHNDCVLIEDDVLGITEKKYIVRRWILPLNGDEQRLELIA